MRKLPIFLVLLVLLFVVVPYTQAALRTGAKNLLLEWITRTYNYDKTPGAAWSLTADPCTWSGVECTAGNPQDLVGITKNGLQAGASRMFDWSGDYPDLYKWDASGFFPAFKYMYIRGAKFGPFIPDWVNDFWYPGWLAPPTAATTGEPKWKIWIQHWNRFQRANGDYAYPCDPCGSVLYGLGCNPNPGCLAGNVCPLPAGWDLQKSLDMGIYCSNLNVLTRFPTHGPITGGTNVSIEINMPGRYYNMSCAFGDILVPAQHFAPKEYFPDQNMIMTFYCVSPPHPAGTVDIHIYWNDVKISTIPKPFDYSCPPGYEEDENDPLADCIPCPAGYYSERNGNCTECPALTYNPLPGQGECIPCPIGSVSNVTGATNDSVCVPCGPGEYFEFSEGTCLPCPDGYFNTEIGVTQCQKCPLGRYSAPDRLSCLLCPAGQYGAYVRNNLGDDIPKCLNCSAGSFSPTNGSVECIFCRAGYYQPKAGQTSCTLQCEPGTYSFANATFCTECSPGTFANKTASTTCKLCSLNYYNNQNKSTDCIKCGPGEITDGRGATICVPLPTRIVTREEDTSLAIAIIFAILAAAILVTSIIYIIYKKSKQAEIRNEIKRAEERIRAADTKKGRKGTVLDDADLDDS